MKYRLFNLPDFREIDEYSAVINKIANILALQAGFKSLYQIGSISNPGISDIDLIAVFENGFSCKLNPLSLLTSSEKYFFTHSMFGASVKHFQRITTYNIYHNYKIIKGVDILEPLSSSLSNHSVLQRQVALEFLMINYLARNIENSLKMLSVRNILLSVNAILFDLQLLNIESGKLYESVKRINEIRNQWFSKSKSQINFIDWYLEFMGIFNEFIKKCFSKAQIYFSNHIRIEYARNIHIKKDQNVSFQRRGLIFPPIILNFDYIRKINKILNKFYVSFNWKNPTENPYILERKKFCIKMADYNLKYLPFFQPLASRIITRG